MGTVVGQHNKGEAIMYKILLADKQNRRIIKIGSYADSLLFKALGYIVLSLERV